MIERIYVQNFRCFESLTINFAGNSSVLIIGKNGSGKSTLRSALALLQCICRATSRVDKLLAQGDFAFNDTHRPMRFEITVNLSGKRFDYTVSFQWPENFREARIMEEAVSVERVPVFRRESAQVELSGGSSFGLDRHVFALPVTNEKLPPRPLTNPKQFLASHVLLAQNPTRMNGFSEYATSELEEDASNFASCLRGLLENKPAAYSAPSPST